MDLLLRNIPGTRASVLPAITDYKLVTAVIILKVLKLATATRVVLQFAKVDCNKMQEILNANPCKDVRRMRTNEAAVLCNTAIQECADIANRDGSCESGS